MESNWKFSSLAAGLFATSALCFAGDMVSTASAAEKNCADLAKTAMPNAQVTGASVEAGGICRVSVTSKPTADSDIKIEVWIPQGAAWNGKYVQLGNGGYSGSIPTRDLKELSGEGYIVVGTDDGHESKDRGGNDGSWAVGHPEKLIDEGWRGTKEATKAGKALVLAAKGKKADKSYFEGCSGGGREGLMVAQRSPDDFDGIVAGAPGNYLVKLMNMRVGYLQVLQKPGGVLGDPQLKAIQDAVLAECGDKDAGFVRRLDQCHFDPSKLLCKAGETGSCLTQPQMDTIKAVYAGQKDPKTGALIFPGYNPGAEGMHNFRTTIVQSDKGEITGTGSYGLVSNYVKYFALSDGNYDIRNYDYNGPQGAAGIAKTAPILDSENPDISAFKKHGGKLIQYHGWNDPNIPVQSSIRYFQSVQAKLGDTSSFYKFYAVPGMLHCQGGLGPSDVNWLNVMRGWVEHGQAPGAVTANATPNGPKTTIDMPPQPAKSQLLCSYPQVAEKTGGDPSVAASYVCKAPKA